MKLNLNSRILKQIVKESDGDNLAVETLTNLLFEEAGHFGKAWYKEPYRKAIRRFAEGVKKDENQ